MMELKFLKKKILFWVFFNQKDTWGFSSFIKNWPMEFFWFFAWIYSNKKVLKLNKITFWGKILSWCFPAKRGQNDPKIRFFKFYKKLILRIFLIFLHKVAIAYIDLTILAWKNLCFTEFSTKIHWNTRLAAADVFHMFTQSIKFF